MTSRLYSATRPSLLALVWMLAIHSVPAAANTRPIRFERLSLEEGLSQSAVNTILQDSQGFLWVGTQDGLNRYDGYSFKTYKHVPSDPTSIRDDFIFRVAEDASHNLWLITKGGGLAFFNRTNGRFEARPLETNANGPVAHNLRDLVIDDAGSLWIGTTDWGLVRLDPTTGRVSRFTNDPQRSSSLSDNAVYVLHLDRRGDLWIGTNGGLNRLDKDTSEIERFQHHPADPTSLSDNRVRSILEDRDGVIWVGTYAGGLNRLDRDSGLFSRHQHDPSNASSLGHDEVRSILEDSEGRLWVGTGKGLDLLNRRTGRFSHYTNDPGDPHSLSSNQVRALYQDRGGALWVGTLSAGLNKWHPSSWSFGHVKSGNDSLRSSHVLSFAKSTRGKLYVGTVDGLDVMERRIPTEPYQRTENVPSNLSDSMVTALYHDIEGTLWVGTMRGGLNRLDVGASRFKIYRHDPEDSSSLSADGVMSIYEDSRGALWIGTFGGGLNRLNRQTDSFESFRHDPTSPTSLGSDRVTTMKEDLAGRLWIGTDGGGLNLFDRRTDQVRRFKVDAGTASGPISNTIYALYVDSDGTIWAGTQGAGLLRVDAPTGGEAIRFQSYMEADGLSNDDVYGILPGSDGSLWLSTNRGLSRFDPMSESFTNYFASDGLQANEFHFGASYSGAGGELIFGGVNGFNAFASGQIRHSTQAPAVALTAFLKLNKPVSGAVATDRLQNIDLGFRDDVVSFEFAALDFADPDQNIYRYRLEGFDDDWIDLGKTHRVSFTDLDGGDYLFRVQAANRDGAWSEEGISLPIHVAPPPWQTLWAYGGYALVAMSCVLAFVRIERRKLEREEEYSCRLEQEVKARSAELQVRAEDLETLNKKLQEASWSDPLTGLANRRFLADYVEREMALVARRYTEFEKGIDRRDIFDLMFMMIDLDDFKAVNDTCGHDAGDQVLLRVKDLLLGACRKSDLVIRWGGDEFLIVGRDSDPKGLSALAERIRSSIEEQAFDVGSGRIAHTTCSIGFACYPFVQADIGQHSWESVMSVADRALYAAKRTGRNAWVGLRTTDDSIPTDLPALSKERTRELVEKGSLEILTSIPESRDIAWT